MFTPTFTTALLGPIALGATALTLLVPALRRPIISSWAIKLAAGALPTIGETERVALEAGTVFWEGELFNGAPNWRKLAKFRVQNLTKAEQKFLENETEALCAMLDDHQIAQDRDLSPKVWAFIKKHKFLGMIIPVKFGGLGFSAAAHAAVVTKIASKSVTAAVTVMVPNSLGPGELLLHYGTPEQQKRYLPGLAKGTEVPCFALTEPNAGSDAASGESVGVVEYGMWQGKKTLGMRLTFNKRYITLAPVATVVGLAFRLHDPKNLLGKVSDVGITCALLPRNTKGLIIGERHDPMGVPFQNGPVRGKDVFVPLDYIIGGPAFAGQGWRMLMECLSTGRGISLPSLAVGASQVAVQAASAYAAVREQFGLSIGKFEGVRERLARMVANSYAMRATQRLTAAAVDAGEKPAVASAIAKAYLTEGMRQGVNDAMDILAGAAIIRGPRNIFARPYSSIPVGITVEGANILTRSLIVFGQGAIRCHPYLQAEVAAIQGKNVKKFDAALFGHVGHLGMNIIRSLLGSFSFGILTPAAPRSPYGVYYSKLGRLSAAFAVVADVCLITLGGSLKRKEYISGRMADALAQLFIASSTLKQVHDAGNPASHQAAVEWALTNSIYEIEQALDGVLRNLPNRLAAHVTRVLAFPGGLGAAKPTDAHTDALVDELLHPNQEFRKFVLGQIHIPAAKTPGMGALEHAYQVLLATAAPRAKLATAVRKGILKRGRVPTMTAAALKAKVLTTAEAKVLDAAYAVQQDVIQVDSYAPGVFSKLK
jgi:acyl-CoA dehydrogenase